MVFHTRIAKCVLSIFFLLIGLCPFYSKGFFPSNTYDRQQLTPTCSDLRRYANSEKFLLQQKHHGSEISATSLHAFPEVIAGAASLVAGFAGWLYIDGAGDRDRRRIREEEEARIRAREEERARQAYIEPKEYWTEAELARYDGSRDEDGPILLAADGLVFNVYKGRNFYLPGCEYHIFAGRDATRLLARNKLEEESEEELKKPLNVAERAFLATWMYTFKGKYDIVGKLEGFDPKSTAM